MKAVLALFVTGALTLAPDDVFVDAPPFRSPAALDARRNYDKAVEKLDRSSSKRIERATERYLQDLEDAYTKAMAKNEKNEALRLTAMIDALKKSEYVTADAGLQVLAARWGADSGTSAIWLDVTEQIKGIATPKRLTIAKGPLHGLPDPADGRGKSLFVLYRYNGRTALRLNEGKGLVLGQGPDPELPQTGEAKSARENYDSSLRQVHDAYRAELRPLREEYLGALDKALETAEQKDDKDEARALSTVIKEFKQDKSPFPGDDFSVLHAYWGAFGGWIEVTKQVREMVKDSKLSLPAANEFGFPDPAFGKTKSLVIVYQWRGRPHLYCKENGKAFEAPRR